VSVAVITDVHASLPALEATLDRSSRSRSRRPIAVVALRALGFVRVARFAAMGLEWHAEQSRKLLAPT
jgi:hypothetical protein